MREKTTFIFLLFVYIFEQASGAEIATCLWRRRQIDEQQCQALTAQITCFARIQVAVIVFEPTDKTLTNQQRIRTLTYTRTHTHRDHRLIHINAFFYLRFLFPKTTTV